MIKLIPLIAIIQGFCLYLYQHFIDRRNIDSFGIGLKEGANSNYRTAKLKRDQNTAVPFRDSALAGKYMEDEVSRVLKMVYTEIKISCKVNLDTVPINK